MSSFDPRQPYNDLPLLPPNAEIETIGRDAVAQFGESCFGKP